MKKATGSIIGSNSRVANSSFKYQEFERPGVSNEEIKEIKEVFDLFDSHRNGVIRPKGTPSLTQIFRKHCSHWAARRATSQSTT